eukprot:TRINITY_DN7925_c0_g3_i4.p1 TRINITY_DN7925_c0_g3~~TRINITY_DN7925_c0_g3_i4.p1  ORF type:complete len:192 (-),score=-7.23 TRINITY_DN7925_c0_g3_i4:333-833(-)
MSAVFQYYLNNFSCQIIDQNIFCFCKCILGFFKHIFFCMMCRFTLQAETFQSLELGYNLNVPSLNFLSLKLGYKQVFWLIPRQHIASKTLISYIYSSNSRYGNCIQFLILWLFVLLNVMLYFQHIYCKHVSVQFGLKYFTNKIIKENKYERVAEIFHHQNYQRKQK